MRRFAVFALIAALTIVFVGAAPASASASQMLSKVNSARKSAGKEKVESYSGIRDDARRHAQRMADEQRVFDRSNLGNVTSGWKSLAQVNGVGPDTSTLFDLFMNSYRSVILGSFNYIGIGAVTDDNGILWVSMIFMNHPDDNLNGGGGGGGTTTTTTTTKPPSTTTSTAAPGDGGSSGGSGGGGSGSTDEGSATASPSQPVGEFLVEPTTTIGTAAPGAIDPVPEEPPATTLAAAIGPSNVGLSAAAADPAPPPSADDEGINPAIIIAAVTALAVLGVAWLALATRSTPEVVAIPGPIVFEPCISCGLVFNHARTAACPRCRTATV